MSKVKKSQSVLDKINVQMEEDEDSVPGQVSDISDSDQDDKKPEAPEE